MTDAFDDVDSHPAATTDGPARHDERGHFRGSTLLVFGKFIGIALDLVTQVVIVRALSKSEYGAFAFGLSVASLAATIALLGLDKTISRFGPLYEEEGDHGRLAGSLLLSFGVVAGVSAAMLIGLIGFQSLLGTEVVENELARQMLLILFLLAPIRAFDSLLTSAFAIFGDARTIIIRRNVIAPGLQLLVVVLVLVADAGPEYMAVGYVLAGAVGLGLYFLGLGRLLARRGIIARIRRREVTIPARAVMGFSLPLLSSDVVFLLRTSVVVILLQYLSDSTQVAAYGAVLPLARQNLLVYQSFAFLFVPVAARLFARKEDQRLRTMYWQTSAWIAVSTFPAFAMTTALAGPLTVLLFGQAYADSAAVLAILAIGQYVSATFGFNALTLRVQGSVRLIVTIDTVSAIVSVLASVIFIQAYGAIGAALATTLTLILQNLLYQAGLARTSVGLPDGRLLVSLGMIVVAVLLIWAVQLAVGLTVVAGIIVTGVVSLALLGATRRSLQIGRYFPELLKIPVLRQLIGTPEEEVQHPI